MKIIINADDFGTSQSTDEAIIQTFASGALSSTTIVANGSSFESACQLAHEKRLLDRVGIHINLTDGLPLTDGIRKCPRFCDSDGYFLPKKLSLSRLLFPMHTGEKLALANEVKAQIARCRKQGLPLTHADSHNHIHTEIMIGTLIMDVLKEEGIPFLRLTRNIGSNMSPAKKAYKHLFNGILSSKGLRGVTYFGDFSDLIGIVKKGGNRSGSAEIMCHPVLGENGSVRDLCGGSPHLLFKELRELIPDMQLTTYRHVPLIG
ncbi:carbohydrate deacetylase [Brevibacillus sp. GCM10020057]|uniref:carbohydrate deacetylase n=1 Tax=Brevibacillus sp. GCM10020057 TaxID=3317327 RepID=UPI0036309D4E